MKFAVFTDLHYDFMMDADLRIDSFIDSAKRKKAEFVIDLGDLCFPIKSDNKILEKFKQNDLKCYHVLGNHNTDKSSLEEVLNFFDMDRSYYSFTRNDIKFIVLDANNIRKGEKIIPYSKRNYNKTEDEYPYVPLEQINWLKSELEDESKYYIILSHQSLSNDFMKRGVSNRERIRKILEDINKKNNNILLCVNGHDHGSDFKKINGINYYTLNSISYIWHGMKEVYSYSKEIHEKYPYLKDMILYKEPLHIIVDIDKSHNIKIKGIDGHYQKHPPIDVGLDKTFNGVCIEPKTLSVYIKKEKLNK